MVTEVALDACQVSVTLWPLVIEVELAERVMVGATFGLALPHETEPQTANKETPHEIQRNGLIIIRRLRGLSGRNRPRSDAEADSGGCRYIGESVRPSRWKVNWGGSRLGSRIAGCLGGIQEVFSNPQWKNWEESRAT